MAQELNLKELENVTGGVNTVTYIRHYWKHGETIYSVAKAFNCSVEELAQVNRIRNLDNIDMKRPILIPKK